MRGRWISLMTAVLCALPLTLAGCGNNGPPDFTLTLASGQTGAATITQGGTAEHRIRGGSGARFDRQHHAGVEWSAAEGRRRAGRSNGGDRFTADFCSKCGLQCVGHQRPRHADGDRHFGKCAELRLDHAFADR